MADRWRGTVRSDGMQVRWFPLDIPGCLAVYLDVPLGDVENRRG